MATRSVRAWWDACTKPWTETFARAIGDAGHARAFANVALAAVLGVAISWLLHRILAQPGSEFMGLASVWVREGTASPVASWLLVVPFGVVYGFYTFQIVLFLFAKLLRGKGSFCAQSYAQSLFYAPLAIVQQAAAATPVVGRAVFALVALASLVPTTTSLKAVHRYSTSRAVLTWVLPIILNIVITILIVVVSSRHR